ncbi:DeoR/GlpR family DNA-binding transcription regulator [Notoacmeibacter ruber]|uniref:DeoR/GlpR transcriptional regulator n=1 Tax=Notoacmeibacter ruber TaxID=2670375 RepID=A0A3L7JD00_9HYPH|nr:DeoR/GlpR family DNA-binding transcription regulator [Notoacmeibacter ruber]RLQ88546.1 DeoR/GlpR transcriptional regulator [Notoacmeibacter ruber]
MAQTSESRRLKKQERHQQILLELKLKPHVRVADLAGQFGVTTETVRRDIEDLSREGLLQRAHGGASAPHPGSQHSLDARRLEFIAERERLGQFAATLVSDGDTIMIDAGATVMEFARALAFADRRVLAITNSLQVALILGQSAKARVKLAPGAYLPQEAAVVGTETCDYLKRFHVDACFLGASGLSEAGVTEAIEEFDTVKRTMMGQSRLCRFLIDGSKFGRTHLSRVASFSEIDTLVSDTLPQDHLGERLQTAGVNILTPLSRRETFENERRHLACD